MRAITRPLSRILYSFAPGVWASLTDARKADHREVEKNFLTHLVDRGSLAVDIGAHHGLYTRALARLGARVIAFEPFEEVGSILEKTTGRNVTLRPFAISDTRGTETISIPLYDSKPVFGFASLASENDFDAHPTVEKREITVSTVDDEITEPCSFIKIDVEGHELKVLHGAKRVIEQSRPAFLIESEARHAADAPYSIFEFFKEIGYQGNFILRNKLHPVSDFDASKLQRTDALEFEGVKQGHVYVNNFFFLPAESPRIGRLRSAVETSTSAS